MCNLSFQYSWKSCFCEYRLWMSEYCWMLCAPPADQWPRSLKQQICPELQWRGGEPVSSVPRQCVCIMNIMCHLVQALASLSQTGNDVSSRVWMAICHVLSHPANWRITAKPGVMDSSHATSHPEESSLVRKMCSCSCVFSIVLYL